MIHRIEAFKGCATLAGKQVYVFATVCGKQFHMAPVSAKPGSQVALREHPQNPDADDQPCATCFGLAEGEDGVALKDDEGNVTNLDNDEILTDATEDRERDGATLAEDDGRDLTDRDGQVLAEDDGQDLPEIDGQVLKEEKEDFPPTQGMGGWI